MNRGIVSACVALAIRGNQSSEVSWDCSAIYASEASDDAFAIMASVVRVVGGHFDHGIFSHFHAGEASFPSHRYE